MGQMKNRFGPLVAKLVREGKTNKEVLEEISRIYNIKDKDWIVAQINAVRKNSIMRNLHE